MSVEMITQEISTKFLAVPSSFPNAHGYSLHKTVAGIRDQIHIYGQRGSDSGQKNGQNKNKKSKTKRGFAEIKPYSKKIHKPCEYNAERYLKNIGPFSVFPFKINSKITNRM